MPCQGQGLQADRYPLVPVEKISLYADELEALKLCDLDGLTQEEAGRSMGVSRGTVQRILSDARRKTALALSGGKALVLEKTLYKEEAIT